MLYPAIDKSVILRAVFLIKKTLDNPASTLYGVRAGFFITIFMKNQAKFTTKKTILNSKLVNESPEMERRMRLIANLIIDRIFDDKLNNTLKFQPNSQIKKKENKV